MRFWMGTSRLAAILALVFLEINDASSGLTNDGLFELVMAVASGTMRDVAGDRRTAPAASHAATDPHPAHVTPAKSRVFWELSPERARRRSP